MVAMMTVAVATDSHDGVLGQEVRVLSWEGEWVGGWVGG